MSTTFVPDCSLTSQLYTGTFYVWVKALTDDLNKELALNGNMAPQVQLLAGTHNNFSEFFSPHVSHLGKYLGKWPLLSNCQATYIDTKIKLLLLLLRLMHLNAS